MESRKMVLISLFAEQENKNKQMGPNLWTQWGKEMVGWHHQLNGYESEQILGDSEGQGCLACFSLWGPKES